MNDLKVNTSLEVWASELLAKGSYAFTLNSLRHTFPNQSENAIKFALKRLVDKNTILSIHKGYYLIIPQQYKSKGILPPSLYLDAFIEKQSKELATQIVKRTANTMKLENQSNSKKRIQKAIEERTASLKSEMPKILWDQIWTIKMRNASGR